MREEQIKERQKELSAKKELYMIGNSHIDPVWFWTWEEGMQEVKATYASALERMKEFEAFRFSSTSTVFFGDGSWRAAGSSSRTACCPAARLLCGRDFTGSGI